MISVVFVILSTVRKQLCKMWNGYLDLDQIFWININRLLTEREGRGSSVSKLFIIWHSVSDSKMHFRWLALKGLPPCRILDDARNSDKSKLPRVRKTNLLNVKSSKISLNKTSETLGNGIWEKQLLILKLEKGSSGSSQCQVKLWKLIQNWTKLIKNSFKVNRPHRYR